MRTGLLIAVFAHNGTTPVRHISLAGLMVFILADPQDTILVKIRKWEVMQTKQK